MYNKGAFDTSVYIEKTATRRKENKADFDYSKHNYTVHPSLDPRRINAKQNANDHVKGTTGGFLESLDSDAFPQSNAIVVCIDVTGSNIQRAEIAQRCGLVPLMESVPNYLTDPQLAIWANDDILYTSVERGAIQLSEFETDNQTDEHFRNLLLVGGGGPSDIESYDLLIYAAGHKVWLDCVKKRGKKGYMFIYADERFPKDVRKSQVFAAFGDTLQKNIPIEEAIEAAKQNFNIFPMWPAGSSYPKARDQYVKLFGEQYVITLQDPGQICHVAGGIVATCEKGTSVEEIISDYVKAGDLTFNHKNFAETMKMVKIDQKTMAATTTTTKPAPGAARI